MKNETPENKAEKFHSALQAAGRKLEQAQGRLLDAENQANVLRQNLKNIKREYKLAKKAKRQAKRRLASARRSLKEVQAKAENAKAKQKG